MKTKKRMIPRKRMVTIYERALKEVAAAAIAHKNASDPIEKEKARLNLACKIITLRSASNSLAYYGTSGATNA